MANYKPTNPEDEEVGIGTFEGNQFASTGKQSRAVPEGQSDDDDPFDIDKYRQAAGVAYEFSKKKMEEAGGQERETIGKGATEQRTSAEQSQQLKEKDEARDYGQAQRAYRY